jgi:hypothetical protein
MGEDPIGYTTGFTAQAIGFVDLNNKRTGAIARLAGDHSDQAVRHVIGTNVAERLEKVFGAGNVSAVYSNSETETGELYKSNLPKIISEVALKDAMTLAPEEFGLGDIDFC